MCAGCVEWGSVCWVGQCVLSGAVCEGWCKGVLGGAVHVGWGSVC